MAPTGYRIDTAVITMPKRKPNSVVVHRVELGQWERNMVKPILEARGINQQVRTFGLLVGAAASVGAVWVAWEIGNAIYDFATKEGTTTRVIRNGLPLGARFGWDYLTGTGPFAPKKDE